MPAVYTPEAKALVDAARALARTGAPQGSHLLQAAFGRPFPSLARLLNENGLRQRQDCESLVSCLRDHTSSNRRNEGQSDVAASAFSTALDTIDGAVTPELLVAISWRLDEAAIRALKAVLDDSSPGVAAGIETLKPDDPPALGPDDSLQGKLHPQLRRRLGQAKALAKSALVSSRTLLRVMLSDLDSPLSKALLRVDEHENIMRLVGGRASVLRTGTDEADASNCNSYLTTVLRQALRLALAEGRDQIDERDVALALAREARLDRLADLGSVGPSLDALTRWLTDQESQPKDTVAVGEVPIDDILTFLTDRVINQQRAIEEIYRPVLRVRLGLGQDDALAGVYLFVGPPGVGKSMLGKLMAQVLFGYDPANPEAHCVVVECGRYKDVHAVTDLFGAPHGYVGSDKGILRDAVRDKYPCVIVFDEAEKMNVGIWDSLLTIFNDGVYRDESVRYSLKDCVVVLTCNAGLTEAENYRKMRITGGRDDHAAADKLAAEHGDAGTEDEKAERQVRSAPRHLDTPDDFWHHEEYRETYKSILRSRVAPHFGAAMVNRIDSIVVFNGLETADYVKIATRALDDIIGHIYARTGVQLSYRRDGPNAIPTLLARREGTKISMSARDMNRAARRYLLDDAFSSLMLASRRDNIPLESRYRIEPVLSGSRTRSQLEGFSLVPEFDPPSSKAPVTAGSQKETAL